MSLLQELQTFYIWGEEKVLFFVLKKLKLSCRDQEDLIAEIKHEFGVLKGLFLMAWLKKCQKIIIFNLNTLKKPGSM